MQNNSVPFYVFASSGIALTNSFASFSSTLNFDTSNFQTAIAPFDTVAKKYLQYQL